MIDHNLQSKIYKFNAVSDIHIHAIYIYIGDF